LLACCNPEPFKQIDITESIIQKIWEDALVQCEEKETKDIPFKTFYPYLIEYFSLKEKPEEAHYLKEALRLSFSLKASQPDPSKITLDNFGVIVRLFNFCKEKDEGFIKRMVEVFNADWFYGCVDRMDAQNQLAALTKQRKLSNMMYFIVRFANSKQLCFTYQKKDGSWENANIDPNIACTNQGYVNYVKQYSILKYEDVSIQKTFTQYKPNVNKKKEDKKKIKFEEKEEIEIIQNNDGDYAMMAWKKRDV